MNEDTNSVINLMTRFINQNVKFGNIFLTHYVHLIHNGSSIDKTYDTQGLESFIKRSPVCRRLGGNVDWGQVNYNDIGDWLIALPESEAWVAARETSLQALIDSPEDDDTTSTGDED